MKQRCRKPTATQRDPTLDRQWPRGVESSIPRQLVETDSQQIETFSHSPRAEVFFCCCQERALK